MKKLIALLLMFVTLIPCTATGIDIRKEGTTHHGGARMPAMTKVDADYEGGIVTLNVTGYTGNVQVYVNDSQGNIVGYTLATVSGNGTVTLSIDPVIGRSCFLNIALDNATYYGQFDV